MRTRTSFLLLLAAALWTLPVTAQTITRTFDVDSGGTLELRLDAGGTVIVTGGSSDVEVRIEREGRDADEVEISFDERGDRVIVDSGFDSRGRHNAEITYEFSVPSRFNIDLHLTGGGVTISGVSGRFTGQTMGGGLTLEDLSGRIDLQTMGGSINLSDSELSGKVHTMGGSIDVTNVRGDVEATTMGGNVTFRGVQPTGNAEMRVETMGGDIKVEDAPGGADVHTMGGDIEVGQVGQYLKAETMGGDIEVEGVDGWIEASTMGGDITARITGGTSGDRHVDISSKGGDIELTIPGGLSVEFDIEVVVEGNKDPSDYVIESDFHLDVAVPTEARRGRRTRISAVGTSGGGENLVRIRTTNGNVHINRGS